MNVTRLIFAFMYIIFDLVYVVFSKPAYDAVVKNIQGYGMGADYFAIVGAYSCMALGWYVLAAGTAEVWAKTLKSVPAYVAGALAGLVFGLATIGMFNFTVHAMFKNYDWKIVARDMTWGIGWPTVLTAAYAAYIS